MTCLHVFALQYNSTVIVLLEKYYKWLDVEILRESQNDHAFHITMPRTMKNMTLFTDRKYVTIAPQITCAEHFGSLDLCFLDMRKYRQTNNTDKQTINLQ